MAKRPVLPAATAAPASIAKAAVPVVNVQRRIIPIKAKRLRHPLLHSAKQLQRKEQGVREERRAVGIAGSMGETADVSHCRMFYPFTLRIQKQRQGIVQDCMRRKLRGW